MGASKMGASKVGASKVGASKVGASKVGNIKLMTNGLLATGAVARVLLLGRLQHKAIRLFCGNYLCMGSPMANLRKTRLVSMDETLGR